MRPGLHGGALVLALLAALAGPAAADEARRSVAVLEFRAGSQAMPRIGSRLAGVLGKASRLEVVTPDEARQRFASIDAAVNECSGAAPCIGRLGGRLGVDEVLLVGVSELGDVILTLQRIESRGGRVAARLAEAMTAGAGPGPPELERYLRRVFPERDFQRFGTIRVETNVSGAAVFLGSRRVGATPLSPIRVRAPSDYQVTVKKKGFSEFRAQIAVGADSEVEVHPELAALASDAWYRKWWVLAIAGAATAGAVGAAILVTRDADDVPVTIEPFSF